MSKEKESEGFIRAVQSETKQFCTSLIREAIQEPINGISQVISAATGKHLPPVHLVDSSHTRDGFGDTLGSVVGETVDYLLVNKLTHGKLSSPELSPAAMIRNNVIYGAVRGGFMTSVDPKDGDVLQQHAWSAVGNAGSYWLAAGFGRHLESKYGIPAAGYIPASVGAFKHLPWNMIMEEELRESRRNMMPLPIESQSSRRLNPSQPSPESPRHALSEAPQKPPLKPTDRPLVPMHFDPNSPVFKSTLSQTSLDDGMKVSGKS